MILRSLIFGFILQQSSLVFCFTYAVLKFTAGQLRVYNTRLKSLYQKRLLQTINNQFLSSNEELMKINK